jgi:hypothetical protein
VQLPVAHSGNRHEENPHPLDLEYFSITGAL